MINKTRAIELLEKAVELKGPEYVDPKSESPNGCSYVDRDTCGCIVGTAFYANGATLRQLLRMDVKAGSIIDYSNDELPEELTQSAQWTFYEAQMHQDAGEPWGNAVDRARAYADRLEGE